MHRGREGVVRTLGLIAVIVRVQQLFARNFVSAVCNDLVHVHVGLGAAAGLPDREREVAAELTGANLFTDGGNQLCLLLIQDAEAEVCESGSFLQIGKGGDDLCGDFFVPDFKVLEAALCLCAPELICGDLDFPHRIMFDAVIH